MLPLFNFYGTFLVYDDIMISQRKEEGGGPRFDTPPHS